LCPSSHNMEVPNVTKSEFQLMDIDGDAISVLLESGETKEDLNMPADDGNFKRDELREAFDSGKNVMLTVQQAMNKEAVIAFKTTDA